MSPGIFVTVFYILFYTSASNDFNQSVISHLLRKRERAGFLKSEQVLDFQIGNFPILVYIIKNLLHLRSNARSDFLCGYAVHIGQNDLEGIGSNLNSRLLGAIRIQIINLTNTRAVGLNQVQTVENVSEIFVSRLRNTATDIVGGKTGQKSADRNKLDFLVIYVDNN